MSEPKNPAARINKQVTETIKQKMLHTLVSMRTYAKCLRIGMIEIV